MPTINKNTSTGIGGGVLVIRKDNISMKEIGIVDKVYAQANICELKHDNIVITIKTCIDPLLLQQKPNLWQHSRN